MPQLIWDELDFLYYLEADPVVTDDGASHNYEIKQNDLRLLITVWQYESVIKLSLLRDATNVTIFSFVCFVRGNTKFVNDKRGKFLELADCVIAPSRFWYLDAGNLFDHDRFPHGLTIELEVRPEIRMHLVPFRDRS